MTTTLAQRPLDDLIKSIGLLGDEDAILQQAVDVLRRHHVSDGANIALLNRDLDEVSLYRAILDNVDSGGERLEPIGVIGVTDWFFSDLLDTGDTRVWVGALPALQVDQAVQAMLQDRLDRQGIQSGAMMPLRSSTRPIGLITFLSRDPEAFDDHTIPMLARIGTVLGMTLEKARLIDQLESRLARTVATTERLAASNRDLEEFAYVAAHDLQEPLRKIRAFGDRLESKASERLTEQETDYLNRVLSAAERMQSLINDLLDYSRVNTRAGDPQLVDLNGVIAGVLSDLEIAIAEADAIVEIDDLPTMSGDATQLRQLFQNLIENALKFRAEDRVCVVSVTVRDVSSEWLHVDIVDNGIGFDGKYLDRIFKPFQRLHSRTEYTGSGIGLAVCRRIAERHGGFLEATSVAGTGSTFTLRLPILTKTVIETLTETTQ